MARSRLYFAIGAPAPRGVCRLGLRTALRLARHPHHRPQGCAVRRSAKRCPQTRPMQVVGQGMHARAPHWCVDGVFGRIMRRLLQLRTPKVSSVDARERLSSSGISAGSDGAPTPTIRFRDLQIEMAHGAGGKASRRLIEGLIAPILCGASNAADPLSDAAHLQLNGAHVALTTDSFVVKPLRFPGGSIGELAVNG